jgi:magnesium transporter
MINFYKKSGNQLQEIDKHEAGCWINIYPPFDQENLQKHSELLNIPLDFLIDSLDIDERSRYEEEDDVKLIVINTPILNEDQQDGDAPYVTVPIGVILKADMILTISPYRNPVLNSFLANHVKNFDPANKERFVLQLLEKNVNYFLHFLKEINIKRNIFEKELSVSMRNDELTKLLKIQKSLVYFVTTLRSNELTMMKMQRTDFLKIAHLEEETDELQDVIVDNSQALEMANVYTNILNGTMEAFSSIISNNLNFVMKRLTSVTIVLMVPTLVASFYGMNVKLPFAGMDNAFFITLLISIVLATTLFWFFIRKKWF